MKLRAPCTPGEGKRRLRGEFSEKPPSPMHPIGESTRTLAMMSRDSLSGGPAGRVRGGSSSSPQTATGGLEGVVVAVAGGDTAALGRLYDATMPLVYALAERLMGDPFRAEEAVLDVYRYVWERAASFDAARGSVTAWLMSITRGRSLDRLRSDASRRGREEEIHAATEAPDDATNEDPEAQLMQEERSDALQRALLSIPSKERRVIEMAFFQALSHARIAEELDEPLGTIKSRIRRGLLHLHDLLKEAELDR